MVVNKLFTQILILTWINRVQLFSSLLNIIRYAHHKLIIKEQKSVQSNKNLRFVIYDEFDEKIENHFYTYGRKMHFLTMYKVYCMNRKMNLYIFKFYI